MNSPYYILIFLYKFLPSRSRICREFNSLQENLYWFYILIDSHGFRFKSIKPINVWYRFYMQS